MTRQSKWVKEFYKLERSKDVFMVTVSVITEF